VPDLATLAKKILKEEGIGELEFRSGRRGRKVARARKIFCQLAVGKMGYPGAEVARYLGVTTSSVNRLAVSQEATDLKRYLKML
jgi:hypothetical protein